MPKRTLEQRRAEIDAKIKKKTDLETARKALETARANLKKARAK